MLTSPVIVPPEEEYLVLAKSYEAEATMLAELALLKAELAASKAYEAVLDTVYDDGIFVPERTKSCALASVNVPEVFFREISSMKILPGPT